jgi:hypothetical protein
MTDKEQKNFPIVGDLFWTGRRVRKFYMCTGGHYYNPETGRVTLDVIPLTDPAYHGRSNTTLEVRITGLGHDTFSITASPLRAYQRQKYPCLECTRDDCKTNFLCPLGVKDHRPGRGPRLPIPGHEFIDEVTKEKIEIKAILWEPSKELVNFVRTTMNIMSNGPSFLGMVYKPKAITELLSHDRNKELLLGYPDSGVSGYHPNPWSYIEGGRI